MTVSILMLLAAFACDGADAAVIETPSRVVVVVLENKAYGQIIGSADAPYINALAQNGALFTQSFAITHPSQPNYLVLFSGSDQGVTDDTVPAPGAPFASANLGAEMLQAGLGFIGYSESLPSVGYLGASSGSYVRRHAPWTNWQGAASNAIPDAASQPFSAFPSDYGSLPTVSFVIPNLDHDMHDGSIAAGDLWLHDHLDGFVQWARANDGLLILTFDEDDGSAGNHIATIFVGGGVRVGTYDTVITHRDVLRTIEAMYGVSGAGSGGSVLVAWSSGSDASSSGGHKSYASGMHCGVGSSLGLLLGLLLLRRR
jgi:hypothetical protein